VKLYRNSPTALVAVLLIGVTQGALWMLAPLYAIQIGLTTSQAAYFAAAFVGAGAITQWPIGRLSDRLDRRLVLLGLAASAVVVSIIFMTVPIEGMAMAIMLALLAGVATQPAYAIAASHAFDHADRNDYVETSSGMNLAFGIGSSFGPLTASYLMQSVGSWGLFLQVAVIQALMGLYILSRLFQRAGPTVEEKTDFDYAASAQVGTVLSPEPLDLEDPSVIPPEEFPAYDYITEESSEEASAPVSEEFWTSAANEPAAEEDGVASPSPQSASDTDAGSRRD
jgi:MFS family permease